ncbi:helix-turn-helix domain-containing protein [Thalassomonas sp. RHCl1]|uniref:helix-turn-helix domain-containing protein n=1 Tax=Thalassomonas sp. RHCl1 TaxID=2995320 RepID=UPI00248AE8EC|nr:helix-turn-helix domain-containing protein [Thalassomonas sp. RHCl1]
MVAMAKERLIAVSSAVFFPVFVTVSYIALLVIVATRLTRMNNISATLRPFVPAGEKVNYLGFPVNILMPMGLFSVYFYLVYSIMFHFFEKKSISSFCAVLLVLLISAVALVVHDLMAKGILLPIVMVKPLPLVFLLVLTLTSVFLAKTRYKLKQFQGLVTESLRAKEAGKQAKESDKGAEQIAVAPNAFQDIKKEQFMHKLNLLIDENISNPDLNCQMLAQLTFMSEKTLRRKVHSSTGINAGKYLKQYRMKTAYGFVLENKYSSTKTLASAVGFKDPAHFNKAYKAYLEVFGTDHAEPSDLRH